MGASLAPPFPPEVRASHKAWNHLVPCLLELRRPFFKTFCQGRGPVQLVLGQGKDRQTGQPWLKPRPRLLALALSSSHSSACYRVVSPSTPGHRAVSLESPALPFSVKPIPYIYPEQQECLKRRLVLLFPPGKKEALCASFLSLLLRGGFNSY